jgi:oligopeptide transport system substrate-binding protein
MGSLARQTMRKAKWILFVYMGLVVLIVTGLAVSFNATRPRDPHTLYLPLAASVKTLDPAEVNDTIGSPLVGSVYECLYNYKFGVEPYTIFPELASDMPDISPDGKTMTIKLRKGIHFYDPSKTVFPDGKGPELKASDVVYSFKRMCDFNLASANYSGIFEGNIAGLDSWWEYTQHTKEADINWDKPVEGFEAVDEHTVRLKLTHPNPQMIYHLAHEPTGIVSRDAVKKWGEAFRRHPVGTGPYALVQNLPDQRLVFEENPLYRGQPDLDGTAPLAADDPKRMPHIKRVQYDFFVEELPVWILFKQGLFDVAGIPKDSFRQAIGSDTGDLTPEMTKKGVLLTKHIEPTTEFIGFNMQDPIVGKNKPLRQAMSMAFDRKTYIENFLNGRGTPAIGIIPPGFPTYDEKRTNPYTQFDVAKAKALMVEAQAINQKLNGGPIPPLTLLMRDSDTLSRQMAEYFVSQMRGIGVELKPEFRDWARWQEMVDNRQTQVFDAGWQSDYPDEQDFLQLFYSKNIPNAGLDETCYNNPKFDALYEKATVMQDTPERRAIYMQMEEMLMDDCPVVLEVYLKRFQLRYDWVGNYYYMDYGYAYRQYFTLDEALRKKRFSGGMFH